MLFVVLRFSHDLPALACARYYSPALFSIESEWLLCGLLIALLHGTHWGVETDGVVINWFGWF